MTERRVDYLFKDMKITDNLLPDNQYYKEKTFKKQIVLHHTAGGSSAVNTIHGWTCNPEKVGTAFVIDGAGQIFRAFDPDYWAHHLGLKTATNTALNKASIGIEVCNWGQLVLKDGKFYNYVNKEVHADQVVKISKFRCFEYYHKYTDAQLESLKWLIQELCAKYSIDRKYNAGMFELNSEALAGNNGIYTHVSYRADKNDMSPQPNLINVLKSI